MSVRDRLNKLEQRLTQGASGIVVLELFENKGETEDDVIARYEAEHGPIDDPFGKTTLVFLTRFGDEPCEAA